MISTPLDRIDVGMEIAHPHPVLREVLGQVLGHPLGEHGHEDPVPRRGAAVDLPQHVIDLGDRGAHLDLRVHEPRRAHELLDHVPGTLPFVGAPEWPTRTPSGAR